MKPTEIRARNTDHFARAGSRTTSKNLDDSLFARTQRMSRFLRFGVEHALAGTGHQVKEYLVGVDVFDRPKDYDPRVDPIVRVEARRLRAKLRSYYASSGKTDELIIDFPKGAYAAEFHLKSSVRKVSFSRPRPRWRPPLRCCLLQISRRVRRSEKMRTISAMDLPKS